MYYKSFDFLSCFKEITSKRCRRRNVSTNASVLQLHTLAIGIDLHMWFANFSPSIAEMEIDVCLKEESHPCVL